MSAHELVRAAIAGAAHDGLVNPNDVRPLIPSSVPPHIVGTVYRQLRHEGILVEHDHVRSTDLRGRNSGKLVPRYRLARPLPAMPLPEPPPPARKPEPRDPNVGPCAKCGGDTIRYGDQGSPLCEWCRP